MVINKNYMAHKEILLWLENNYPDFLENTSILELGCGDAYVMGKIAEIYPINTYIGIDLSDQALSFAEKNLQGKVSEFKLVSSDMQNGIKEISRKFDIVFASYSIHHLQSHEKEILFNQLSQMLKENGHFFLIDVLKRNGETRASYFKRCFDYFDECWTELSPRQVGLVKEHVSNFDYPESFESTIKLLSDQGFQLKSKTYLDENKFYGGMHFTL